jgi:hypothetical protein
MDVQELERVMDQCLKDAERDGLDFLIALTDCIDRYLQEVGKAATVGQVVSVQAVTWQN